MVRIHEVSTFYLAQSLAHRHKPSGEILNLEWRHVDLEKGIAFLKETKNGRPRSGLPLLSQ